MKRFECVLQDGPKDCGICALLTIIKSHNGYVSKEYLRNITNTTKNGVNALSLVEAGKKLGFYSMGVKGDILNIEDKYLPCIAHVIIDNKYNHFVVIHKIDRQNKYVTVADPARGILKIDIDKFKLISTNNYLIFTPNTKIPVMEDESVIKNKIASFIYDNQKTLLTILVFSGIYVVLNIIISLNFQFVIDRAIENNSYDNLYTLIILFLFIYSLKNILDFSRNKLINFISHKLNYALIIDSLNHILSLPHLYFKNRTTGEVLSRITDLDELKNTLCDFFITICIDLVIVISSGIILLSINKKLTIIIMAVILLYVMSNYIINKYLYNKIKDVKEQNALVNSSIIELINGIDSIKSLNILEKSKENFSLLYNRFLNSSYSFSNTIIGKEMIETISTSLVSLIILMIGGGLVINNEMRLSTLISFNSIILFNINSLKNLINYDITYKKSKIAIERINELLNIKEEKLYLDINPINNIKGNIEIKNLSYKYSDENIINNLNLKIEKGKKVLLYGESGCGKSTLAKILSGYINIKRNKVFIDNVDINDINLWNLREQVTYVSQNEYIFSSTILENITLKSTKNKNKIIDICNMMKIDEIIANSKNGYNMMLEENGRNVSGGQRQRIILARSFLKDSNIYILDESFSEINIEKEREIMKSIFSKFSDKTIIVISHRFNNNDLFDEIYNMKDYENRRISRKLQEQRN